MLEMLIVVGGNNQIGGSDDNADCLVTVVSIESEEVMGL